MDTRMQGVAEGVDISSVVVYMRCDTDGIAAQGDRNMVLVQYGAELVDSHMRGEAQAEQVRAPMIFRFDRKA